MNKEPRISVRIPPELKARLAATAKLTGIDEPTLVRNCIESIVDYIEKNQEITFPLVVKPRGAERNQLSGTNRLPENEETTRVEEKDKGGYDVNKKPNSPGVQTANEIAGKLLDDAVAKHKKRNP